MTEEELITLLNTLTEGKFNLLPKTTQEIAKRLQRTRLTRHALV